MNGNQSTFIDISSRWLSELAGNVDAKTIEHYRWSLESFVYPEFGEKEPQDITEEDVRNLLEKKRAEGLSEGSVYAIPKLIWRILSYASSEGLCEAPQWNIVMGKPERMSPTVILSYDQEKRLLTYLTENPKPKYVGIYLILTTGMNIGEMLKLTWADVSLYQKQIRVLKEAEGTPDARNKFRIIPINERQRIFLKKVASLPTVYVASGKPKPASPYAIRDNFIRVLKELNLPEMPLSDLRRTFAVHCLEGGMGYEKLSEVLGQKNSTVFRAYYRELVSPETRERLEQEMLEARKPRQAPEHTNCIGPDLSPEVVALRQKVEAKKKQLNETLAALEGDLEIIHTLRRSNLAGLGRPREGMYQFIEKVLGDDRDGKMLVEYLRCNMRVADMPSQKVCTVQTIRSRVARGFAKLMERLDAIYAVEGFDILDMFHKLTARIQEIAPPEPVRPGRKHNPTVGNEFKKAMAALDRIVAKEDNGTASQ